jgi:hypothetical protein
MLNEKQYIMVAELCGEDYDWSSIGVWRKLDDNSFWFAEDSGCSCTCPFEELTPEELEPVRGKRLDLAVERFQDYGIGPVEKVEFLKEVRRAVREVKG